MVAKKRRQSDIDEAKYERMLREGRGQGAGATYRPWCHVDEGRSLGRCHRTASHLTGYRIHHLRSNLEYFAYLEYWWDEAVEDIREHYPLLPLARTLAIAQALGIRHPRNPRTAFWIPQTVDFFVVSRHGLQAAAIMEDAAWKSRRIRQRFDIAETYLAAEGVPLTPRFASQLRTQRSLNLMWIYDGRPALLDTPILECGHPMVGEILHAVSQSKGLPSQAFAQAMDRDQRAAPGTALHLIRRLLAEHILATNVDGSDISRGCLLSLGQKWHGHF